MPKSILLPALPLTWLLLADPSWAEPRPEKEALVDGSRSVLQAIVRAGEANAGRPKDKQRKGDELTVEYIRAAAAAAASLPRAQAAGAFLVGLGLGLDDSTILRNNPVVSAFCRKVETDAERGTRLKVLGKPTMRARRDWTQHFVVSCACRSWSAPRWRKQRESSRNSWTLAPAAAASASATSTPTWPASPSPCA